MKCRDERLIVKIGSKYVDVENLPGAIAAAGDTSGEALNYLSDAPLDNSKGP